MTPDVPLPADRPDDPQPVVPARPVSARAAAREVLGLVLLVLGVFVLFIVVCLAGRMAQIGAGALVATVTGLYLTTSAEE